MESHGVDNEIQVSEAAYQLLKGDYEFEDRGSIEIKGKGVMSVYLLMGKSSV